MTVCGDFPVASQRVRCHAHDVAYVNGPNGKRLCTKHDEEFDAPHQCPKCLGAHVMPRKSTASLDPQIAAAITDEVVMFEGIAEEAGAAADNAATDSGKAALMRIKLSAASKASDLRMERTRADMLARLAAGKTKAASMPDPRDDFGTAASGEIFVAGDN